MQDEHLKIPTVEFPTTTVLLDGTPVLIRPVSPDDKPLFKRAFQRLSSEDRYNRFFQPVTELSDEMLRKFTEIDHENEEAIGAMDISKTPAVPVGIARYVRSEDNPDLAEIAVTVIGDYHGKGVGTLLLAVLATRAIENQISQFSALVLERNSKMQGLLDQLEPISKTSSNGTVDYCIGLHKDPDDYPHTPTGDLFRDVSNNTLFQHSM